MTWHQAASQVIRHIIIVIIQNLANCQNLVSNPARLF
jgi:hypothetical protein